MGRLSQIIVKDDGTRWKRCTVKTCRKLFQLPPEGDRSRCPSCDRKYSRKYFRKYSALRQLALDRMSQQTLYGTCTNETIDVLMNGSCNDLLRLKQTRERG